MSAIEIGLMLAGAIASIILFDAWLAIGMALAWAVGVVFFFIWLKGKKFAALYTKTEVEQQTEINGSDDDPKAAINKPANNHKAGYFTLWVIWGALLIFGAAMAIGSDCSNLHFAAFGILIICAAGLVLWLVLFSLFENEKLSFTNPDKYHNMRGSIIIFALSLIPVIIVATLWIVRGLSPVGTAYFAAFAVVAMGALSDIVLKMRLRRK